MVGNQHNFGVQNSVLQLTRAINLQLIEALYFPSGDAAHDLPLVENDGQRWFIHTKYTTVSTLRSKQHTCRFALAQTANCFRTDRHHISGELRRRDMSRSQRKDGFGRMSQAHWLDKGVESHLCNVYSTRAWWLWAVTLMLQYAARVHTLCYILQHCFVFSKCLNMTDYDLMSVECLFQVLLHCRIFANLIVFLNSQLKVVPCCEKCGIAAP